MIMGGLRAGSFLLDYFDKLSFANGLAGELIVAVFVGLDEIDELLLRSYDYYCYYYYYYYNS